MWFQMKSGDSWFRVSGCGTTQGDKALFADLGLNLLVIVVDVVVWGMGGYTLA